MKKIHRVLAGVVVAAGLSLTTTVPAQAAPAPTAAQVKIAGEYDDLDPLVGEYVSCVEVVGFTGPWVCVGAAAAANNASTTAQQLFPTTLRNGTGDAFRHCFWNAQMTISYGAVRAERVATNHEDFVGGPAEERSMDLANNATGRQVGINHPTNATSKDRCAWLASNGGLVTLS